MTKGQQQGYSIQASLGLTNLKESNGLPTVTITVLYDHAEPASVWIMRKL